MATDLIVVETINPVAVFAENGLDDILKKIDEHYRSLILDPSTAKGREEIRSIAFQITKTRTGLFKAAKDLTEDWRVKTKSVNDERGRMEKHLLALEEEIRRPLTEFEEREKGRVAGHEKALADLAAFSFTDAIEGMTADELADRKIKSEEFFVSRTWEEFEARAQEQKLQNDRIIQQRHDNRVQWDKDQAELKRLREEQAERDAQAERDRIANEAAEKAKAAAEAEAAVDLIWEQAHRDNAEFDRLAEERERIAAQERAETAEYLAMYSEAENENRLFDAEIRRKADVAAAEQRAADNAWLKMVEEAEQENAAFDEQARKDRNTRHRGKVNNQAMEALFIAVPSLSTTDAKKIISAIVKGEIPHVSIQY